MSFRTLTLADAVFVTTRMRQADADCLSAVCGLTDPNQFAIRHYQDDGAAWTLLEGETPVAIGGVRLPVPWCGVLWMVATDGMSPAMWKKLIRQTRIVLGNAPQHLRRIECHVLGTWAEASAFAKRLGFELEGVRRNAGRDGQDILTYVYRGKP